MDNYEDDDTDSPSDEGEAPADEEGGHVHGPGCSHDWAGQQEPPKEEVKEEPPKEEPKKKKEPKPLPADYIMKAADTKQVADEDKVEEVAGGAMDADFLGGFDAFDDDYWSD